MSEPKRGPGVTEETHRRMVAGFLARQEKRAADAAAVAEEVERLYQEAIAAGSDTTWQAIRDALAERRARDRVELAERQARAARAIVGSGRPAPETVPAGRRSLSEADVLRARRRWQNGAGQSPWRLAGVSKSTYQRARRKYGLQPWPEAYREKMTP